VRAFSCHFRFGHVYYGLPKGIRESGNENEISPVVANVADLLPGETVRESALYFQMILLSINIDLNLRFLALECSILALRHFIQAHNSQLFCGLPFFLFCAISQPVAQYDVYFPGKLIPMWLFVIYTVLSFGLFLVYYYCNLWFISRGCCLPTNLEFSRGRLMVTNKDRIIIWKADFSQVVILFLTS
jgi:hypothetical protein